MATQRTSRFERVLLGIALAFVFAAGINAATHHWWDMAGEFVIAAVALWARGWRFTTHPEDECHRCGSPMRSWYAPSPLWNAVMRGGSISGPWEYDEIICPTCFTVLAEERGVASGWRLDARDVRVELETTTPSGRVWNAEADLWMGGV